MSPDSDEHLIPARFAAGTVIGGYRLERRLGQGGMASVFLAADIVLGRRVALKVLPADVADPGFRRRFTREPRLATAVHDPHIIPVHEAGEDDGILYIAMRYVPGGDAGALLRRSGSLSPERAAAIISPVACALDAAHGAGLVHRDVKPANILIDARPGRPDHVYLADFGISKPASPSVTTLTGAGTFVGTLSYAAPEQIRARALAGAADQYSLACTAYELLTGQPPFAPADPVALIAAHLLDPAPAPSARDGRLASADPVFARALAKDPAARYPSCRDFADDLRSALGLAPYIATDPQPEPVPGRDPAPDRGARPVPATRADAQARPRLASRTAARAGVRRRILLRRMLVVASAAVVAIAAAGVRVLLEPSGPIVKVIRVAMGPDAIAMAPDGSSAYVANSGSGAVTPISLATGTPRTPIQVGAKPVAIAIAPDGRTAYVADSSSGTVTPISLATGTPGTPIQVGAKPVAIAIAPDGRTAYVADSSSGTVTPIDLATRTVRTPIQVAAKPTAIAITPDGHTAYVTDSDGMVAPINLAAGRPDTALMADHDPDQLGWA